MIRRTGPVADHHDPSVGVVVDGAEVSGQNMTASTTPATTAANSRTHKVS
jgi:hypothetical protein